MREPKPLFDWSADINKFRAFAFEWLALPMIIVVFLHTSIWLIVSFVAWDAWWMSFFTHRLLFTALCLFVWGALISDEPGDDK